MIWLILIFAVPIFVSGVVVGIFPRWLRLLLSLRNIPVFADKQIAAEVKRMVCFIPATNMYVMFLWIDGTLSDFRFESPDAHTWTQQRLSGLIELKAQGNTLYPYRNRRDFSFE
jgi:cytochrome b subunit of formate dehydrogenase